MELTAKHNRVTKLTKTEGYWIYDDAGNKQLDLSCGSFAYTLGYGNQEIINAISKSLSTVTRAHLPLGQTTDDIQEMENLILSKGNFAGIVWALSGSGAVEAAVHIGQTYFKAQGSPRDRVLVFGNGWHGTTATTKKYSGMWPLPPQDHVVSVPTPAWTTLEERDVQEAEALAMVRETLNHAKDIGMILINPNPWFNGVNPWSETFWKELDVIRNEFDILIITDDVASCWGKTSMFHSYRAMMPGGMQPDISALGKALTAGYAPLSAAVATQKVADVVRGRLNYSHTFQPYVGGIAAMKATSEIIARDCLLERVDWIQFQLEKIGQTLVSNGQIQTYTAYGTCAAYDLPDKEVGKDLKDKYYGLSTDLAKIPNFRVCIPLIADTEYFSHLEQILVENLK